MTMTDEEREALELECANAKMRCREANQVLLTLSKIAKTYFKIHDLWRKRFEAADRKLAMEYRFTRVEEKRKGALKKKLTKEDLMDILRELEEETELKFNLTRRLL